MDVNTNVVIALLGAVVGGLMVSLANIPYQYFMYKERKNRLKLEKAENLSAYFAEYHLESLAVLISFRNFLRDATNEAPYLNAKGKFLQDYSNYYKIRMLLAIHFSELEPLFGNLLKKRSDIFGMEDEYIKEGIGESDMNEFLKLFDEKWKVFCDIGEEFSGKIVKKTKKYI